MAPQDYLYNLLLHGFGCGAFPFLRFKLRKDPDFLRGRFGKYPDDFFPEGEPRIWFHASSVGEVTGAVPTLRILKERLPASMVCLTVGTPQGARHARAQLPPSVPVLPFPLDFPRVLRRAFDRLNPDLYVGFESEFWPNLFRRLRLRRIPAVLMNGRLTDRSAGRYAALGPVFKPIFRQFEWLAMHSEEDMKNALRLGADPGRTRVLGSSKYDGLASGADPARAQKWRELLGIPHGVPVVIGGSLRGEECVRVPEVFLELLKAAPDAVGIFVPRHLERISRMTRRLEARHAAFHLLSSLEGMKERRTAPIVLVDRIGILFELYALGDLIFCGGTLEPIGGHNILEPSAWKKAVFYGPHLKKVLHEHRILQQFDGSFLARDESDLLSQWSYWIRHLPELAIHGRNAAKALDTLGGVAAKQVDLILATLPGKQAHAD